MSRLAEDGASNTAWIGASKPYTVAQGVSALFGTGAVKAGEPLWF